MKITIEILTANDYERRSENQRAYNDRLFSVITSFIPDLINLFAKPKKEEKKYENNES